MCILCESVADELSHRAWARFILLDCQYTESPVCKIMWCFGQDDSSHNRVAALSSLILCVGVIVCG